MPTIAELENQLATPKGGATIADLEAQLGEQTSQPRIDTAAPAVQGDIQIAGNEVGRPLNLREMMTARQPEPPQPVAQPAQPVDPDRNVLGDAWNSLKRGALALDKMVIQGVSGANRAMVEEGAKVYRMGGLKATTNVPVSDWLDKAAGASAKEMDDLAPVSKQAKTDGWRRAWTGGIESVIPSVGAMATGALIGGPIGAVASGAGLFGASRYSEARGEALKQGKTPEQAHDYGLIQGAIEGGAEGIGDYITLGFSGLLKRPALAALNPVVKSNIGRAVIAGAKAAGITTTEFLEEVITEVGQTWHDYASGMPTETMAKRLKNMAGPAGVASLIFGLMGLPSSYINTKVERPAAATPPPVPTDGTPVFKADLPGVQSLAEAQPPVADPRPASPPVAATLPVAASGDDATVEELEAQLEAANPAPTVDAIHTLADSLGIKWDNDPAFMAFTKRMTGKEHLDDLTPYERREFYGLLQKSPRIGPETSTKTPVPPEQPAQTVAPQSVQPVDELQTADASTTAVPPISPAQPGPTQTNSQGEQTPAATSPTAQPVISPEDIAKQLPDVRFDGVQSLKEIDPNRPDQWSFTDTQHQIDRMRKAFEDAKKPKVEVSEKKDTPRGSTQVTVPEAQRTPFVDFANSIPDSEVFEPETSGKPGGHGRETEPHITALFGLTGEGDTPQAVKSVIEKLQPGPIKVTLGKLSVFDNPKYDVLKLDVSSPQLTKLNAALRKLPNENDFPDYQPHLTIAYLKKGEGKKYVGDTRFEGTEITIPSLTHSNSERVQTDIPLSAPSPSPAVATTSPASKPEPAETTPATAKGYKFTSEREAKAWAKKNNLGGMLKKLDTELYRFEPTAGDVDKASVPGGWYLNEKDQPVYAYQDQEEINWLRGPYVFDYVQPEDGRTGTAIVKAQFQSDNEQHRKAAERYYLERGLKPPSTAKPAAQPPTKAATPPSKPVGSGAIDTSRILTEQDAKAAGLQTERTDGVGVNQGKTYFRVVIPKGKEILHEGVERSSNSGDYRSLPALVGQPVRWENTSDLLRTKSQNATGYDKEIEESRTEFPDVARRVDNIVARISPEKMAENPQLRWLDLYSAFRAQANGRFKYKSRVYSNIWNRDLLELTGKTAEEMKTRLGLNAELYALAQPAEPVTPKVKEKGEAKPQDWVKSGAAAKFTAEQIEKLNANEKADPNIGRSWNSTYGKQTIAARLPFPSGDLYSVTTEGTGAERRYDVARIEEVIQRNEHELTPEYAAEVKEREEMQAERQAADARQEEAQKQVLAEIEQFTAGMTPMAAGKVRDALLKMVNVKGTPTTRKTFIEQSVKNGYTVKVDGGKRELTAPDESFFDESTTTKAGMDYAEYLLKSSEPQPAVETRVPKGAEITKATADLQHRLNVRDMLDAKARGVAREKVESKAQAARAEKPRTLLAVHNLTADKLAHALKIGGLPMPSIAVIDVNKSDFEGFGDITLVGNTNLITPSKNMRVVNADMYSPRYPNVKYSLPNDQSKRLATFIHERLDKLPESARKSFSEWTTLGNLEDRPLAESLRRSDDMAAAFLMDKGFPVEFEKAQDDRYQQGHDRWMVNKVMDALPSDKEEFTQWVDDTIQQLKLQPDEKIFKGFTPGGNRQYLAHNLDVVVRLMKAQMKEGEGFNYGTGSVRSKAAKQYRTVAQIQADREKIIPGTEMKELKEKLDNELIALADDVMPSRATTVEGFGRLDAFSDDLVALAQGDFKWIREMYADAPEAVEKMRAFLNTLRDAPTEYFEAKAKRAVGLHEFTAAVVPKTTSPDLIATLEKRGLQVETYDKNVPGDRKAVLQRVAGKTETLFSQREAAPTADVRLEHDPLKGVWKAIDPDSGKVLAANRDKLTAEREGQWMLGSRHAKTLFSKREGEAQPMFYSGLSRAIEGLAQERFSPQQLKAVLSKTAGVKADELKWTGLGEWLDKRSAAGQPVTKAEALQFVRENQVSVTYKERGVSQKVKPTQDEWSRWDNEISLIEPSKRTPEQSAISDKITAWTEENDIGDTKFRGYMKNVPTDAGYFEAVLTLPTTKRRLTDAEAGERINLGLRGKLTKAQEARYNELSAIELSPKTDFRAPSAHAYGDEASDVNRVANVIGSDVTLADGAQALAVWEMQSDWQKAVRKEEGMAVDSTGWTAKPNFAGNWQIFNAQGERVGTTLDAGIFKTAEEAIAAIAEHRTKQTPSAPLLNKWHELAFKTMLRRAIDSGKDALVWNHGSTVAERYDLSKEVDSIVYFRNPDGKTFDIDAKKDGKNILKLPTVKAEDLPGTVGKDVADRMVKGDGMDAEGVGTLTGDSLRVGGKWAENLYDRQLVSFAKDYTKKWGGKVEDGSAPKTSKDEVAARVYGRNSTYDELPAESRKEVDKVLAQGFTLPVHVLRITDAMRQSVEQGQPLFKQTPRKGSYASVGVRPVVVERVGKLVASKLGIETGQLISQAEGEQLTGESLDGTEAFWHGGKTHYIAENIGLKAGETAEQAVLRVMLHEEVGHRGVELFRQDAKFRAAFDEITKLVPDKDIQAFTEAHPSYGARYGDWKRSAKDRSGLVREMIAFQAEAREASAFKPWHVRVWNAIRAFLRRNFPGIFGMDKPISKDWIDDVLSASKTALREEGELSRATGQRVTDDTGAVLASKRKDVDESGKTINKPSRATGASEVEGESLTNKASSKSVRDSTDRVTEERPGRINLDKIPQEGEWYEVIPRGDKDPLGYGGNKFYLSPEGRWISVQEHEEGAAEMLTGAGVQPRESSRETNPNQADLELKRGYVRVIDEDQYLYVSSQTISPSQLRELKNVAIEYGKGLIHDTNGREITLLEKPDADTLRSQREGEPPAQGESVDKGGAVGDTQEVANDPATNQTDAASRLVGSRPFISDKLRRNLVVATRPGDRAGEQRALDRVAVSHSDLRPNGPAARYVLVDKPMSLNAGKAEKFAEAFGKRIIWFKDKTPEGFLAGVSVSDPGVMSTTIFVNASALHHPLSVASHEITHEMMKDAPALYQELKDFISYRINEGLEYVASLKRKGVWDRFIGDEVVADFVQEAMRDPVRVKAVLQKNPSLFDKFWSWILKRIVNIKKSIGVDASPRAIDTTTESLDEIRDKVVAVLRAYHSQVVADKIVRQSGGDVETRESQQGDVLRSEREGEAAPDKFTGIRYTENETGGHIGQVYVKGELVHSTAPFRLQRKASVMARGWARQRRGKDPKFTDTVIKDILRASTVPASGESTKGIIKESVAPTTAETPTITESEALTGGLRMAEKAYLRGRKETAEKLVEAFRQEKFNEQYVRELIAMYIKGALPPAERGAYLNRVATARNRSQMIEMFRTVDKRREVLARNTVRLQIRKMADRMEDLKIDPVQKQAIRAILQKHHNQLKLNDLAAVPQLTNNELITMRDKIKLRIELGRAFVEGHKLATEAAANAIVTRLNESPDGRRVENAGQMDGWKAHAKNILHRRRLALDTTDNLLHYIGGDTLVNETKIPYDIDYGHYLRESDQLTEPLKDIVKKMTLEDSTAARFHMVARQGEAGEAALRATLTDKFKFDRDNLMATVNDETQRFLTTLAGRNVGGISSEELVETIMARAKDFTNLSEPARQFVRVVDDINAKFLPRLVEAARTDGYELPIVGETYANLRRDRKGVPFEKNEDGDGVADFLGDRLGGMRIGGKAESGFNKARVPTSSLPLLWTDAVTSELNHIDDVAFYLNTRKTSKIIQKAMRDDSIRELYGDEGQAQVQRIFADLARNEGSGKGRIVAMDFLRRNMNRAVLAFRPVTAVIQNAAYVNALAVSTAGEVAWAAGKLYTDRAARQFVYDVSPEIKNRVGDDLSFIHITGDTRVPTWSKLEKLTRVGMSATRFFDTRVAGAAWLAAYRAEMKKKGVDITETDVANWPKDEEAAAHANLLMRRSQSSHLEKDAPGALRSGDFTGSVSADRALFAFQSFGLNNFSSLMEHGLRQDAPAKIKWLAVALAATLAETLIRYGWRYLWDDKEKDDKKKLETIAKSYGMNTLQNVPLAGTIASGFAYEQPPVPVIRIYEDITQGAKRMVSGNRVPTQVRGAIQLAKGAATAAGVPGAATGADVLLKMVPKPTKKKSLAEVYGGTN